MYAKELAAWRRGGWQPDVRASLALASGALLLLTALFVALLTTPLRQYFGPAPRFPERMVFRLPAPDVMRSPRVRPPPPRAAGLPLKPLSPLPPLPRPVTTSIPSGDVIQDYLRSQQPGVAERLRTQVTGGDLTHELQKPAGEMPALRDDQSFRTTGGDKVVRSGDDCAQIHAVQGSSSPTNHIDIAEPTACPGGTPGASRDMGKALDDWARKVQQSRPPP